MLTLPASKVSVPLTVVMRMRSKTPESAFNPVFRFCCIEALASDRPPNAVQMLEPIVAKMTLPFLTPIALFALLTINPDVLPVENVDVFVKVEAVDTYPVTSNDPEPI